MTALFFLAAALQFNDADPLRWMAIYGAAATVTLIEALNRQLRVAPAAIGLGALAWAGLRLYQGAGHVPPTALFSEWEMKDQSIVIGREMYGLLIVAGWMAVCVFFPSRRSRRDGPRPESAAEGGR